MAVTQPQFDDRPQYFGFYIERMEVLPSEKDANPKWDAEKSSVLVIWNEKKQWARVDPEIVDLRYIYGGQAGGGLARTVPGDDLRRQPAGLPLGSADRRTLGAGSRS